MLRALISPGRYVQGAGALGKFGTYAAPLGEKALLIGSRSALKQGGDQLSAGLGGITALPVEFAGEASKKEIKRLQEKGQAEGVDFIIGFGGGKAIDTAKAVAHYSGLPVAIIPSIAATDAPTSALSVIYSEEGVFEEYLPLPRNPDLVLVDTSLIARAPVRFLVSGMGDALATKFEAEATSRGRRSTLAGGTPTDGALSLANLCYETLVEYGPAAKAAAAQQAVSPALERIVEANTLLSGIGFESGGLAAAHAIHNGFTALGETDSIFHGEKVAFATIAQLILEDQPMDLIEEVICFCQNVGLPTSLAQLGIKEIVPEDIMRVAQGATAEGETIHNEPFPVTAPMVYNAILSADALGRE
ncbi:MAG: glycerol dehydrogenase [Firmicutes bacterium]|nr:glycerol dehydrogenase [Bacillota bacterium]